MNELHLETSPYLLQHANNPVHWKAWNNTSLTSAKEKNSLIVISIGYSACHWCHVMEHESFENESVAAVMNAHFVNIKVDREERPDVDAVYMKAVQIMTGHGGWPLNIVALPDGRPVWGGTYFRIEEWTDTLEQLQKMYQLAPEKMIDYAEKLHQGINAISIIQNESQVNINQQLLVENLVAKWKKSFDWEFGGMARAPKFMMPNNYHFLLRYAHQNQDNELLDFVNLTLTKMAYGGIFDTVDGGFSRYSVDIKWHVPHFEKMLYDNGQLISLYSDAYKLTQNPLYKEIIEKSLNFVNKEWKTAEGGFYSALDADSLNDKEHLEEGAFYVWKNNQLKVLIKEDFELFSQVFNINSFGLWEEENYVLIQNRSLETIAEQNHLSLTELASKKKNWEQLLYTEREKRAKPRLDDKCLTSWNAIMLKGYVDAYKALRNQDYLNAAIANANFIIKKLWSNEGHLFHSYKNGTSSINGYLEDYCFVIGAFIAIYEVTLEEKWLHDAKQLTDYTLEHFYDAEQAFFRFTSDKDDALISVHFETEDNVIQASNSVMAKNLNQLGIYFNNSYYEKVSQQMLAVLLPMIDYPSAYSNWLDLSLSLSEQNRELAICGPNAKEMNTIITGLYMPNVIVAGTEKSSPLPFLKDRFTPGKNLFYVCQNKTCQLPVEDFQEMITQLSWKS
ncbi:thioredoxin domain-containing protein [Flavobacterium sp.]|uniref:thioredoxin domain-containing protein n=1 Tax=Flavobacterium sp. TaxID=239 RepID=UPI0008AAC39D|nr:thioredoxin domain-containing protein [Flavobacterium sp.]OGS65289.1 MAG: thioredoxin [Flavobacteria bacterium GWA2_35_26]HCF03830.1 thioredoxin domain-containing protein [Flavobacterium sp.]